MMKIISFLPALLLSTLLFAQKQTYLTLHFDFDQSVIRPAEAKLLDSLTIILRSNQNINIEIYGHCDSWGRDSYNDTLSLKRARSVKKYLLAKGIDPSAIGKVEGRGETMPVADVRTVRGLWVNRRVELLITENISQPEINKSQPGENSISKIISDTATKAGSHLVLKNLNFAGGTHQLLNSSLPTLMDLLAALQKNENLVIRIEGHICCVPNASDGYDYETRTYNLSEERARTVYSFLINNQIKPERLSFIGFGHQLPIYAYPEKREEERIMNRRVEIRIIRK